MPVFEECVTKSRHKQFAPLLTIMQRVYCPEISLPAKASGSKRKREGETSSSSRNDGGRSRESRNGLSTLPFSSQQAFFDSTKEEIREIMKTVKEFNSNSELGSSRRKFQEDLLTKLGAKSVKQPTMPFKLHLALDQVRKRKEAKKLEELKQSDEVSAMQRSLVTKSKRKQERRANKHQKAKGK